VTIAKDLARSGIAALCIDYADYTGGPEEIKDAVYALEYLGKTASSAALIGYSYGSVVASNAAVLFSGLKGLVLIAPLLSIDRIKYDPTADCPKLIICGLHDSLIAGGIEELYAVSKGEKQKLSLDTDHFYGGFEETLAAAVRDFLKKVMN
jgi:alpha/beta superfamily hydrolase